MLCVFILLRGGHYFLVPLCLHLRFPKQGQLLPKAFAAVCGQYLNHVHERHNVPK
jgi:hypothetical protein